MRLAETSDMPRIMLDKADLPARGGGRVSRRPAIALIAHDGMKSNLVEAVRRWSSPLSGCRLVATASTGALIAAEAGLAVEPVRSGPLGGDVELAARAINGCLDLVVFLRDPHENHPHQDDIRTLCRLCDVYDVPIATNLATAELCLSDLLSRRLSSVDARLAPAV